MSNLVSTGLLAVPEDDTQFFSAFHMHVHASSYVPIHSGTNTHIIKGVFLYTEFVYLHVKIDDNAFLHPLPLSPSEPSSLFFFPSLPQYLLHSSHSLHLSLFSYCRWSISLRSTVRLHTHENISNFLCLFWNKWNSGYITLIYGNCHVRNVLLIPRKKIILRQNWEDLKSYLKEWVGLIKFNM